MTEAVTTASQAAENKQPTAIEDQRTARWQRKLLPLMMVVLLGLTIFFALANIWEVRLIQTQTRENSELNIETILSQKEDLFTNTTFNISFNDRMRYLQWKVSAVLEAGTVNSRYRQARTVSLNRTYIVFIGFTTGMILALVGATFILGKLRESSSTVGLGNEFMRTSVISASPGLILVAMGTTLMLTTILTRSEVSVTDGPSYLISHAPGQGTADNRVNALFDQPVATTGWPHITSSSFGPSLPNNPEEQVSLLDSSDAMRKRANRPLSDFLNPAARSQYVGTVGQTNVTPGGLAPQKSFKVTHSNANREKSKEGSADNQL